MFEVRKSFEGFNLDMIKNGDYPNLPSELKHLNYRFADQGNVIMVVPECFENEAKESGYDLYEIGLPVRYVLEKGYRMVGEYAVVSVAYDPIFGAVVPDEYYN